MRGCQDRIAKPVASGPPQASGRAVASRNEQGRSRGSICKDAGNYFADLNFINREMIFIDALL
jgi:hypothetical protein